MTTKTDDHICDFKRGRFWHTFEYLENSLIEASKYVTIDPRNKDTWSEALATLLVLNGNAVDTFFRNMIFCPNIINNEIFKKINKPARARAQTVVVDSEFIDIFSPEGFERMVIREQDMEPLGGLSIGESTPICVLYSLARNLCDGAGMVILDGVFGRLAREVRFELLSRLGSVGLEQIILLESLGFDRSLMERFNANTVELQYPLLAD